MIWGPDAAGVLADVPETNSARDEVLDWAEGLEPSTKSMAQMPDARQLSTDITWLRFRAMTSFWDERGPDSALRAVAEALNGLCPSSEAVCTLASCTTDGLHLYIGVPGQSATSLTAVLEASLPGVELHPVETSADKAELGEFVATATQTAFAAALFGRPTPQMEAHAAPIVERLVRARLTGWTMVCVLVPAQREQLRDRFARLAHLGNRLASEGPAR